MLGSAYKFELQSLEVEGNYLFHLSYLYRQYTFRGLVSTRPEFSPIDTITCNIVTSGSYYLHSS